MRNVISVISTALLAFLPLSCQATADVLEEETAVKRPNRGISIKASFEQPGSDTKTSLSTEGRVLWSAGDEFALLSASGRDRFTLISGEGTASATFRGSVSGKAPYYALYPYSEECTITDGKLKFKLPQEQTAELKTFGIGASPAIATMATAGDPAQFKNLCGVLLYPDNEPRYRMIYVHGGHTPTHSTSLNEIGRSRIRTFYNNGGSYVGTCAGGSFPYINKPYTYLEIIPTKISGTNLGKAAVDMIIPDDSPLLDYYDFGGDFRVDSVVHNGGAYVAQKDWITNLEVLARFDYPNGKFHNEANIAAYKTSSATKGRIVTCSSHPEGMVNGERRELMAQPGGNKTLSIDFLDEGVWYVSVYCPDAPKISCSSSSFTYSGDKTLLNGVPYTIKVEW